MLVNKKLMVGLRAYHQRRLKVSKPKKELKYIRRVSLFFALPAVLVQLIFGWFPILTAFIIAFQKFNIIRSSPFVGLDNFKYLLRDPITFIVFKNTFYYTALSIGLTFLLPILIAIFLMEMKKSVIRIMMILWFIPVASMAGIIIWKWFYNVQYGLFNGILISLGFPPLRWLNDPRLAMLSLVLPGLIMYGPGLIYIATLQSIPEELYEAAELEGVSFWGKIWYITLPRMRPIIAVMLILGVIGNLQVFNQPFIMTAGGPGFATYSVVMRVFMFAFDGFQFGKATALAIMLFFTIMALVIIQRRYFKENIDI